MPTQATPHIALTVGTNLRAARNSREWTQREVADRVGVTPKDVSRWESGAVEPGGKYRLALADLFFDGNVAALYSEATA